MRFNCITTKKERVCMNYSAFCKKIIFILSISLLWGTYGNTSKQERDYDAELERYEKRQKESREQRKFEQKLEKAISEVQSHTVNYSPRKNDLIYKPLITLDDLLYDKYAMSIMNIKKLEKIEGKDQNIKEKIKKFAEDLSFEREGTAKKITIKISGETVILGVKKKEKVIKIDAEEELKEIIDNYADTQLFELKLLDLFLMKIFTIQDLHDAFVNMLTKITSETDASYKDSFNKTYAKIDENLKILLSTIGLKPVTDKSIFDLVEKKFTEKKEKTAQFRLQAKELKQKIKEKIEEEKELKRKEEEEKEKLKKERKLIDEIKEKEREDAAEKALSQEQKIQITYGNLTRLPKKMDIDDLKKNASDLEAFKKTLQENKPSQELNKKIESKLKTKLKRLKAHLKIKIGELELEDTPKFKKTSDMAKTIIILIEAINDKIKGNLKDLLEKAHGKHIELAALIETKKTAQTIADAARKASTSPVRPASLSKSKLEAKRETVQMLEIHIEKLESIRDDALFSDILSDIQNTLQTRCQELIDYLEYMKFKTVPDTIKNVISDIYRSLNTLKQAVEKYAVEDVENKLKLLRTKMRKAGIEV